MSNKLVINSDNRLQEMRESFPGSQPIAIRMIAKIISYLLHPVFVPVYIVWFMLFIHPYLFAGFSWIDKRNVLIQAFLMYTFFPVITILLLKGLKFIGSIQLKTQKDRIIPLIGCATWYFWIWNVWHNLPDYPKEARVLALAIWIASSLALLANIIMKISLHAIAIGVSLMFLVLLGFSQNIYFGMYVVVALFLTGIVCTARFIDSDHNPIEIYSGLALGMVTQAIIWWLA